MALALLESGDRLLLESGSYAILLEEGVFAVHVREKPPLRLHTDLETPGGRHYRWGPDEPDPANVPSGLRFSSTMPGGFESADCTLPRKPSVDYADLERLSTFTVYGPGGEVANECRLESAPKTSGDEMSVSPGCVGWQAHLEDNRGISQIYVDRDLSRWGDISRQRRLAHVTAAKLIGRAGTAQDPVTGSPGVALSFEGAWANAGGPLAENLYDSGGLIESIYYSYTFPYSTDAAWVLIVFAANDDVISSGVLTTLDLAGSASGSGTFTPSSPRRFAGLQLSYTTTPGGTNGLTYQADFQNLAVYGPHGLEKRGSDPKGLYASDVVDHAVRMWAPLLNRDIAQSEFVVPHLAFYERTSVGEIVRQASRFGLQDWGVWEDKTFRWHERGGGGRSWRARIGPAGLAETGPQVDRLWNSVVVAFQDAGGETRTVGPVGSGVDHESVFLSDDDPANPANQLGIVRRDLLAMGVSTAAGAIEVGRRFLEEQKLVDRSGRATLAGHVKDDRGVFWPAWAVRAGDTIVFVDAGDTSERRVVRTDYDHPTRTCTLDLDAPPEGLQALLERLSVVLVPLGLT